MMKYYTLLILLTFFLLESCNNKKPNCREIPNLHGIDMSFDIKRNEDRLMAIQSAEEMRLFLDSNKVLATHFFAAESFSNDSLMAEEAFKLLSNTHIDTLYQETQKRFANLSSIKSDLEQAFKIFKFYYPDFEAPEVQTTISGLNQDLYLSDSLVIIGLDYYLGPKSKFTPVNMPKYLARRFDAPFIVPSIVLLMINKYNKSNLRDKTFLADMLFYGKSYYLAQRILPCTADSILIGYKSHEWIGSQDHQHIVWASFLENNMLYETNEKHKQRFLSERPKTLEIGDRCPGRIGTFMGWKIVEEYMKNEDLSLVELMEEDNAQKILAKSKYKPVSPY